MLELNGKEGGGGLAALEPDGFRCFKGGPGRASFVLREDMAGLRPF